LAAGAEKPPAKPGKDTECVDAVTAFDHVGNQAAAEIAVGQARQLLEKRDAQTGLEAAPQPQRAADDDDIQNQERDDEDRQRDHRGDLLITTDQDATQVEKAPEEQGLEDHTRRRNEESA